MGTLRVRSEPASVPWVRRTMRTDLARAGLHPALIDDAALVVTELVSNAVLHARALRDNCLGVRWRVDGGGVTVAVEDGGGPRRPHMRDPAPDETAGRGLGIVDSVSDTWGVSRDGEGVTVWAHLPKADAPAKGRGRVTPRVAAD